MAITKKVIKKITSNEVKKEKTKEQQPQLTTDGKKIKRCAFCQSKTSPSYTDTASLRRFISDRAKIVSRLRSGTCAKHQRFLSKNIKYARHLSLLPFTPKV